MEDILKSIGWIKNIGSVKGTGQSEITFVQNTLGIQGVFRRIKFRAGHNVLDEVTIARYKREISVLTNPIIKNENIIEILEHGECPERHLYWYISKRGQPFDDWWKEKIQGLNADEVFEKAVSIIEQVANGLAIAHSNGIIHRDIKPDNLVVINDVVKIIDWGICHIEGSDRITNPDYPAYNKAFSPSYLYFHRDTIPPWVDIFQLNQLLIYLLREDTKKKIFAPIHWKWVVYDHDLSPNNVLKASLFSYRCSNENTCPANGKEALELIKGIFQTHISLDSMNNSESLKSFLNFKSLESDTNLKDNIENLSIEIAPAIIMYNKFIEEIDKKIKQLKESIKEVRIERKSAIGSLSLYNDEGKWREHLINRLKNPNAVGGNDFGICVEFGIQPIKTIQLTIIFKYDYKGEFKKLKVATETKLGLNIVCRYQTTLPLENSGYQFAGLIIDPTLILNGKGEKINFYSVLKDVINILENEDVWRQSE